MCNPTRPVIGMNVRRVACADRPGAREHQKVRMIGRCRDMLAVSPALHAFACVVTGQGRGSHRRRTLWDFEPGRTGGELLPDRLGEAGVHGRLAIEGDGFGAATLLH